MKINLRIEIDKEYDYITELLNELFNNIQFQNLEKYILNFNMNKFENINRIGKELKIDYNYINNFIIDKLKFKYQFCLKSFINLPNKLIIIKYILFMKEKKMKNIYLNLILII